MIQRDLTEKLRESSSQFPVAALLGPRQSSNTTLAHAMVKIESRQNLE